MSTPIAGPLAAQSPLYVASGDIAVWWNDLGLTWESIPLGSGPAGPQGVPGPVGPVGATGSTGATGAQGPAGSANMTGMVAGQIPLAATASSVTSSTATLTASFMPAFTGDVTSPAGSTVNTLPAVNSNVGTFQGLTVTAKGLVTAAASQTGQVPGTATNNNASAGNVGEFVESNIAYASGVTATTGVTINITSISLTAGDWDVYGSVISNPSAGCVLNQIRTGVSATSATLPDGSRYTSWEGSDTSPTIGLAAPFQRISLAATTTVYLVSYQVFTTAALRIAGTLNARRAR